MYGHEITRSSIYVMLTITDHSKVIKVPAWINKDVRDLPLLNVTGA